MFCLSAEATSKIKALQSGLAVCPCRAEDIQYFIHSVQDKINLNDYLKRVVKDDAQLNLIWLDERMKEVFCNTYLLL
ncbi:MAG: hypothetical protein QXT97_02605 [Candidatus Diapherotrites archaeon]